MPLLKYEYFVPILLMFYLVALLIGGSYKHDRDLLIKDNLMQQVTIEKLTQELDKCKRVN